LGGWCWKSRSQEKRREEKIFSRLWQVQIGN
jgi:hypothetical protein